MNQLTTEVPRGERAQRRTNQYQEETETESLSILLPHSALLQSFNMLYGYGRNSPC